MAENFYYGMGLFGTTILAVKVLLTLLGIGDDGAGFVDGGDLDGNDGDAGLFQFLSLSAISGFFAGFGWTGYIISDDAVSVIFISLAAGGALSFAMVKAFQIPAKLTSYHERDPLEPIGSTTTVYMAIPSESTGKVWVTVGGIRSDVSARTTDGTGVSSNARVTIVGYEDGTYLVEACG